LLIKTLLHRFKRIFLPGIILQSVLIGGGYATGREIVEYGGKFGASGWISGLGILLGFTMISFLTMESCRQWQVYDYKSLLKKLIGKGWVAYEVVYLLLAVLIIAVMAAAAGEILHQSLGFNPWIGVVIIIAAVGFLNYRGDATIARMETWGTVILFIAYLIFSFSVYLLRGNEITATFQRWDTSYLPDAPSILALFVTGAVYVGYNLAVYPASFFTYRELRTRKHTVMAALISGIIMTIPWFLTYAALMGFYPDAAVLDAPVPWLMMLKQFHPAYQVVFSLVVGWTLIETATGMIHGFIGRIDTESKMQNKPLRKSTKAFIALAALAVALLLSQVGMIDLVAKGYTYMAYAMIAVFALPLLIRAPKLLISRK
jgi:uncharacterized membrane protein YkvI